ncbi:uncharacterized protein LOC131004674 [Salvia miltiorrhiza]|uniref:uncharacterized protein LOC131004674 n=1 Tax=Salvia miltiorrhiza TaxID=226208 RepID=UPI0025ABB17F|nr:uncharacterized protein LOC131004674 [Salvia miltiorrhiza]
MRFTDGVAAGNYRRRVGAGADDITDERITNRGAPSVMDSSSHGEAGQIDLVDSGRRLPPPAEPPLRRPPRPADPPPFAILLHQQSPASAALPHHQQALPPSPPSSINRAPLRRPSPFAVLLHQQSPASAALPHHQQALPPSPPSSTNRAPPPPPSPTTSRPSPLRRPPPPTEPALQSLSLDQNHQSLSLDQNHQFLQKFDQKPPISPCSITDLQIRRLWLKAAEIERGSGGGGVGGRGRLRPPRRRSGSGGGHLFGQGLVEPKWARWSESDEIWEDASMIKSKKPAGSTAQKKSSIESLTFGADF